MRLWMENLEFWFFLNSGMVSFIKVFLFIPRMFATLKLHFYRIAQ